MIRIDQEINTDSFTEATAVDLYKEVIKAVTVATEFARKAAREDMRKPKTGNVYRIFGIDHVSSAPGESPAVLTGNLINGLTTSIIPSPVAITGLVSTSPNAPYAEILNYNLDRPIFGNIEKAADHFFMLQIESVMERILN